MHHHTFTRKPVTVWAHTSYSKRFPVTLFLLPYLVTKSVSTNTFHVQSTSSFLILKLSYLILIFCWGHNFLHLMYYIFIKIALKVKKLSNHLSITVINSWIREMTTPTIRTGEATIQTMEILNKEGAEITSSKDNSSSLLWVSTVVIFIIYLAILSAQCVGWTWYEYTRALDTFFLLSFLGTINLGSPTLRFWMAHFHFWLFHALVSRISQPRNCFNKWVVTTILMEKLYRGKEGTPSILRLSCLRVSYGFCD